MRRIAFRSLAFLFAALAGSGLSWAGGNAAPPQGTSEPATPFSLPSVSPEKRAWPDIEVAGFRFEGNTVVSTEELHAIAATYAGRRLDAVSLEELRTRITRLYIDRGYISSGAVLTLPEADGSYPGNIVPVRIVEGQVDAISIRGEDGLRPAYVTKRLVHDGEVLDIHVLQERFRLLLTDPLFARINGRIIPGDVPGKAVLDVDIVRASPYSLGVFANNHRPPSIGSDAIGVTGWLRNLTGGGDVLDMTLQRSRGSDPVHLGWSVPLGASGFRLRMGYDRGTSSVIEEPLRAIDIDSRTTGSEIGIGRAFVDTLQRRIEVGLTYAERENRTTLLGQPFSFTPGEPDGVSRVKAWRFWQDWTERWEKQALAVRSTFAFGSNNIAPVGSPVPVANPHYLTWIGQIQFVRNVLDNGAQILLRGTTQQTRDRLLPLERFAIGGVATVRGYRENSVVRDRGYAASVELRYPILPGDGDRRSLHAIAFADAGSGGNKDEVRQRLSSVGAGISWRQSGFSADVFVAHKMNRLPVRTSGDLQDRGIHLQIGYTFF